MNAILIFNPDAYVNSSGFLVGSLSGVMASELVIPGARSVSAACGRRPGNAS